MKQTILFSLCVFFSATLYAQNSISRNFVGAGGGEYNTTFETIQYSIGEAVIDFYTDTAENLIITQGYQQPFYVLMPLKSKTLCQVELRIWPNPTQRFIHVEIGDGVKLEDVTCYLYHLNGSLVGKFRMAETSEIDLYQYVLDAFILHFVDHQSNCHKVFKVIKN
ncbi:MAG: hypothetical protein KDC83_06030 [Flavobacteriales bacterium]|nr:hypothetical protein [Flavobacteriales bacterium]